VITFGRTQNYELIREILTYPRIYPYISDDYSPPASEYQPVKHDAVWYVLALDVHTNGHDLLGLWMFVPQNGVCWEVHTALLPCAWGDVGLAAAQLLPAWIWEHTPCRRIITNVPATNRLAFHFAIKAGMEIYGTNRASYLKNGALCDQTCLGISAPAETGHGEAETGLCSIGAGEGVCQQR